MKTFLAALSALYFGVLVCAFAGPTPLSMQMDRSVDPSPVCANRLTSTSACQSIGNMPSSGIFQPHAYTGLTAPTSPIVGDIWNDTSASVQAPTVRQWDGGVWVAQGSLDAVNHIFTPAISPTQFAGLYSGDIYISNTNINGIPVGNDTTGNGSAAAPYLTPEKALAQTGLAGRQIKCNTGNYSLASSVTLTTGVAISSITQGGCRIVGASGQTKMIEANPPAGASIIFTGVILDANNTNNNVILVDPTSGMFNLVFNGTKITNAKTYAITGPAGVRVSINGTGLDCQQSSATGCIGLPSIAAGGVFLASLNVVNTEGTISSSQNGGAIFLDGSVSGAVSVNLPYITLNGTIASDSFIHSMITVLNAWNVNIGGPGSSATMAGTASTGSCRPIVVSTDTINPLPTNSVYVHDISFLPNCASISSKAGTLIGFDTKQTGAAAAAMFQIASATIEHNVTLATGPNATGTGHTVEGHLCGYESNVIIHANYAYSGGYDSLGFKGCANGIAYANYMTGMVKAGVVSKGSMNTYYGHNTHYETSDNTVGGGYGVDQTPDDDGTFDTGMVVDSNVFEYKISTANNWRFYAGLGNTSSGINTASFTNNNYYNQGGLASNYAFSYGWNTTSSSTNLYDTAANWISTGGRNGAPVMEPSGTIGSAQITNPLTTALLVQATNLLFGGTTPPTAVKTDILGNSFASPNSTVGAVQSMAANPGAFVQLSSDNTYSGQNKFAPGSVAKPGISSTTDATSGWFTFAAGIWDFVSGGVDVFRVRSNQVQVGANVCYTWSSAVSIGTADTFMCRNGAAGFIRLAPGDAAAPIGTNFQFGNDVLSGTSNVAGGSVTIRGGKGTGTGIGGDVIIQSCLPSTTGTTQNSCTNSVRISGTTGGLQLLRSVTFASLPACNAGTAGTEFLVSDASSSNNPVSGGGNIQLPVYCLGSGATPTYAWTH